jgi:hypothetical protein
VRAPHPSDPKRADLFWVAGGRVTDWCSLAEVGDAAARTAAALRAHDGARTAHVAPEAVDEVRIVSTWVASREPPVLALDPVPDAFELERFLRL